MIKLAHIDFKRYSPANSRKLTVGELIILNTGNTFAFYEVLSFNDTHVTLQLATIEY